MYNLSKPQEAIYYMSEFSKDSISNVAGDVFYDFPVTIEDAKAGLLSFLEKCDTIHTRIVLSNGVPMQIIDKNYNYKDISVLSFKTNEDYYEWAKTETQKPISITDKLYRAYVVDVNGKIGLYGVFHHIIGDASSNAFWGKYIGRYIKGEKDIEIYSYLEYLEKEKEYQDSKRYKKDQQYWFDEYSKGEINLFSPKTIKSNVSARFSCKLDSNISKNIKKFCSKHNISQYTLFFSILAMYYYKIIQKSEFYIGTPVLNRYSVQEENMLGVFVNAIPIRFSIHDTQSFATFCEETEDKIFSAFRHQKYNYSQLLKDYSDFYGKADKMYDVLLSFWNVKTLPDSTTSWYSNCRQNESIQIHIDDRRSTGNFSINYDYQIEKFSELDISVLHQRLMMVLCDAIENPDKLLYELEYLTEDEKEKVLNTFNNTSVEYAKGKCVHQLFEEQVARTPDKVALVASDKTLTYAELNKEANRIAHSLIEKGIGKGDIVGIKLSRTGKFLISLLGVLKAGAAYLPFDPTHPKERIEQILSDSNAKLCVTEDNFNELLNNSNIKNPDIKISGDSLCYCIYTSGSTGTPKGAMIQHKNLCWYMSSLMSIYGTDAINMPFFTSPAVDLSIPSYFLPLVTGGTTYFYDNDLLNDLNDIFNNEEINTIKVTPTHLQIILQHIEGKTLHNMKYLISGGESLRRSNCIEFLDKFGKHIEIHNEYGPTETTVSCVDHVFSHNDNDDIVTIGSPIENAQIYIVDKHNNLLPIGVTGELCIAGDGVCAGYLNNPELTNEKFIDNPFGEGKLYKTGDLAYWREDGNICFVGRNDFQVKINGQRIELGEIENAISGIDGIVQCAVIVRKDQDKQYICAFYTGAVTDAKDFRTILGDKLPKYMLPHIFTHIEEMPLTSSGKISRTHLPEVDFSAVSTETEYVAPTTDAEKALIKVLSTILGVERISMLDNFFNIGGDSINAIYVVSELEDMNYSLQVADIIQSDTLLEITFAIVEKVKTDEKIEYASILPATAAQMRVYTALAISTEPTLYNLSTAFKMENFDANRFENAVNKLIARHEGLRTSFENRNGEIVQIINDDVSIKLEELESPDLGDFVRPFDLTKAPLMRVGYIDNTVVVDLHHIIADGSTFGIFYEEINELYMGRELPETVQYREFAVSDKYTKEDEEYWLKEFEETPDFELYTDYPKQEYQSDKGANIYAKIDQKIHENILVKCKNWGITPYDYYMGCFSILLSKYSGNEDICIGVPSSGRSSKFLNTWGMFVNTLSIKTKPRSTKAFKDFTIEIKNKSFNAITHQKYPQQELIKKLNINKPLYEVMFIFQSEKMTHSVIGDKKAELLPITISTSRASIMFYILPREEDTVIRIEYLTSLFKEETINKFIEAYTSILTQCLNANILIKDIEVLNEEEKEQINSFNNTSVEYAKDKCIHQMFEEQVEKTPDKVALVASDKTLTYAELNKEANRIAHSLIEKGIGKGDIVGLMLPRKSYLLSALFGILKTGAAYLPIDMELPKERIEYMCQDTNAKLVVSEENIDSLLATNNKTNPCVDMANDSLCYCIYTSGSTGQPKGVMARHRNVVNYISKNEHNIFGKIITDDFEAIVSISTCSFDIFVTETIATLVNGLRVVLADEQECRNQYALNRLLTREKGQFLQTTPTKLKALTREPNQREFLKNVKAILLGGEAMEQSYLNELKELTDAKIYNIYGVTEVPIWSMFADTDTFTDAITIGKPIANTQVYIVDKYMNPVPMGVMGELCIAGDSVSSGYLNNPELTAEKFIDNPFGSGKLYKTGDHAYWREDGNLVFIGRKDFQVKIRGLRIELGEIESAIQGIDGIERAVVVVRKDKDDRQLLCAFYTGEEYNAKDLRTILNTKLPKYMVPHIFTHLDKMPMTASGKANRNALPEINLDNINTETEYVAPTTKEETILTKAIEKVLDIENVSVLDNFFDLGGDSLKSIELVSVIEDNGYTVIVKSIFEAKDIQNLAKELTLKEETDEKIEYSSVIPATAAQMRVYTAQFMSPQSTHYNLLAAFKTEHLDTDKLQKSVNELIVRHESLRTSFENRNGQIVQIINESATIKLENLDSDDISLFNTPFDLSSAPLLKVGYCNNTVMLVIHHIIVDGESMAVLCKELNELYMGRELPETVQYGEFAVTDNYTEENEKYWLNVFSEEQSTLDLPTDFARPEKQSFNGTNIYELIDISTHNKITDKCKALGITPYAYYMACYNILLSKYSNNEDICVGMPISGRSSKFLNTIGMFVNTIALRNNTSGDKTISAFMQEVRENSISAIDNQKYPYNELVKKLGISASNRNPLFDVMFAYQNEELANIILGDKKVEIIPANTTSVKFELEFHIIPRQEDVVLSVEYNTDLYKEETINKFIGAYTSILAQALNENILIKDISVLTEEEKENLSSFNDTEHTYNIPENTTLYSLFDEQATKNSDRVCIIANDKEITFADFKAYAERIDNKVRSITNEEKSVIAVICERSFEMYGAVYGIIRGGNAYLPIDPNYPQDRIEYILSNSNAKAVIAQDKFCHLAGNTVCINATEVLNSTEQPTKTEILAKENDTAYVIYTSGSTGNPKGAKISHKSAINRILWMHDFYPLEENDVILQKTPYTFDVSVWELFWWGITGRTLCASKPDEHFLPAKILEETQQNKVTHLHFVPSVFDLFLTYLENNPEEQEKFNSVKYVFLSGEALTANSINRFYNIYDYNKVQLHNLYGPTECAVDVSYYACVPTDIDPVPIGKPIYNTQLHIVDKYNNIVPIGVTGELCIAGVNVGQGYLNNEELTNEKFIPNPFGEGKLYKTGDLAYWREDGNICYVGRNDFQVKINGQRIELGEIENAITNVDGVVQCAVIVREQYICAFYTGAETDAKDFRTILNTKLPRYMVPHVFTHLDKMPMTVSGKLDRKALPPIDFTNINSQTEYVEPTTEKEKALSNALSTVLGVERVSMLDNFFNIGGDSINAIYVVSELEDMNYSLQVADIMQSDNLKDIVSCMVSTADIDNYDQNEVNDLIPFTPIMRAYLKERETIEKDFVHTCIISTDCNEDVVKQALDILVSHHDILRGVFTANGIGIIPSDKRQAYSFQSITINDKDEAIEQLTNNRLDDKLVKFVFCRTEKENLICITVHHFLIDLVSWEILMKDFTIVVNQISIGKEPSLSAKSASFKLWNDELRKFSETHENKEYWDNINKQLDDAKSFNAQEDENEAEEFNFTFSKDISNKLINEVNKKYGTRINEVLLTAIGLAAGKLAGGTVGIMVESHGRTPLPKPVSLEHTIGWFTSCYPVMVNKSGNIADELVETKDTLRKIPRYGIEYLLFSNGFHNNTDILFNFYKNSISNKNRENKLMAFAGHSVFPGVINVSCFVMDNILSMGIAVPKCKHKPNISEELGLEIIKQIERIVDFCTTTDTIIKTRSDFSDDSLTQSELDELNDLFD